MKDVKHGDNIHVLSTSAPNNSSAYAEEVARRYYGIDGAASLLACERDQIFSLQDDQGGRYILRFTNPSEDRQVTNFQTEAMLHIALVDPGLPVPRVIMSLDDEAEVLVAMDDSQVSVARVISFLPGVPLAQTVGRPAAGAQTPAQTRTAPPGTGKDGCFRARLRARPAMI